MTVATFSQNDFTADDPATYKAKLDGNVSVLAGIAAQFAAHEVTTPNMTVKVDAGALLVNGALVTQAQQTTGTITAPVTHPRIDRIVIDATTGAISVVTGTPGASPSAPAIPAGKLPCAQVLLQTSSTVITNSMITDERVGGAGGLQATDLQTQSATAFTTAGTAPNFTLTPTLALTAYAANQRFRVKFNAAGTTGSNTLNVSGLGAKNLKQYDSTGAKQSADVTSGMLCDVEYDGTDMVVLMPLPPGASADLVARDQIALTNLRLLINSAVATGALVQGKQWELSTDEFSLASGTVIYATSAFNYYTNGGELRAVGSGLAGAAGYSGDPYNFWGGSASTPRDVGSPGMITAYSPGPAWAGKDWGAGVTRTINRVKFYGFASDGNGATSSGTVNLKLDGSSDGSSWTNLYTNSGYSPSDGYTLNVTSGITQTAYRYHRVSIDGGTTWVGLAAAELWPTTTTAVITTPSSAVSVSSAPTYMDGYFLWKDDEGGAVIGTDVTCELSRDNGTTYTTATLTSLGAFDSSYTLVKARANVSSQPSGTSLRMKITLSSKVQRVAAPSLYAE
jgi:hypothetical protein